MWASRLCNLPTFYLRMDAFTLSMQPTYFEANPTKLVEPTLSATLYFNLNALPIRMQTAYFRKPSSDLLSTLKVCNLTTLLHTPHSVYPNLLPNFTSIHLTHISILVDLLSQFLFWIETYKDKGGGWQWQWLNSLDSRRLCLPAE